jgi:hypothetical protein
MTILSARPSRSRLLVGVPLAALALAGTAAVGTAGFAQAQPPTSHQQTITMTITNNSDRTLYLSGSDNPDGQWVSAPKATLAPNTSQVVTATSDTDGFSVYVTYGIGRVGTHQVVFIANSHHSGADTDGTRAVGPTGRTSRNYSVDSTASKGAATVSADFVVRGSGA